jgi:CelD/BcsL family acetyltransferase involved in cellulose biosynthesis
VDVIEITTSAALQRIYPIWVNLSERLPGATPFQHPDWLLPWWRHIGGGVLFVIAIQDGGELSELAPFYVHADDKQESGN